MNKEDFLKKLKEDMMDFSNEAEDQEEYYDLENLDLEDDNFYEDDIENNSEEESNHKDYIEEESVEFNAKKISDMILENLMKKNPGKIKRYNRSGLETNASKGFNFGISSAEQDAFTDYYINLLKEEVDGKMTRETQLKILDDASHNVKSAVIYLYCRYLRLIANTYEIYYVNFIKKGNPTLKKDEIRSEESVSEVRELALAILSNNRKGASAYNSFKPEVYDEKADLLDHFGYWAIGGRSLKNSSARGFGYLVGSVIKLAKTFNNGGITGATEGDDARVDSLDDKQEMNRYNEPYEDSHEDRSNAVMMLDSIEEFLNTYKNPKFKTLFSMMRKGYSLKDIAEEMNISEAYAGRILQRLRVLLKDEFGAGLTESVFKKYFDLIKIN